MRFRKLLCFLIAAALAAPCFSGAATAGTPDRDVIRDPVSENRQPIAKGGDNFAEAYGTATKKATEWTATVTPPTCTERGYTTYTSGGGESYVSDYVEAMGHDLEHHGAKAETCTEAGHAAYDTCSRCGYTTYFEIPPTGHDFGEDGNAEKCAFCGLPNPDCRAPSDEDPDDPADPDEPVAPVGFSDVAKGAYYADAVSWAVSRGITQGTGGGKFSPDAGCTRGQVVTFLWRAAGSPEPIEGKNPFEDVKDSDYFCKAVLWAVEKGVTTGTGKTTFSPDATCTRGQIVTFLYRSNGSPEPRSSVDPFGDVKESDYFFKAVMWAVENGITKGTGAATFSPDAACTRAQIVTFLYRATN